MEPVLADALAPVLRDLAASGLALPWIDESGTTDTPELTGAMLRSPDGTGAGVHVVRSDPLPDRAAAAADQVQEWAIEHLLWGGTETSWPPCPRHPRRHPLQARAAGGRALWVCPADDAAVTEVGALVVRTPEC